MKKIVYIFALIITCVSTLFLSCDSPEELTPKVDETIDKYLIPTGSILNVQEREEVEALWNEYNNAINQ
ncbi:hypothetical protein [Bacteroides bouchesdurhonensis]